MGDQAGYTALLKAVPVEVTGKDLQAEGEAIAQRQNTTLDEVRNLFGKDLSLLHRDLQVRKVLKLLWDWAEKTT